VLDLSRGKWELAILIPRLSIDHYDIPTRILLGEISTIEPYRLSIGSIAIDEDSLDEELLVASHLTRDELDTTLDDLFFDDIQEGEFFTDITLIFDIPWEIREELLHRLYPRFTEFLDIGISRMQEWLGEEHTLIIARKKEKTTWI
jgi:hypothetical protein